MDKKVIEIMSNYTKMNKEDILITWKCKALKNWKYLCITTALDNKYYELTYNGETKEWYLDEYQKVHNVVVTSDNMFHVKL